MNADRTDLKQVLGLLMDAERPALAAAVTTEEILAWTDGELPEDRAEAVRDLLAADPGLARVLVDARDPSALAEIEAQSVGTDAGAIDAGWRDLMSRLGAESAAAVVPDRSPPATADAATVRPFVPPSAREPSAREPSAREPRVRFALPLSRPWAWAAGFAFGVLTAVLAWFVLTDLAGRGHDVPSIQLVQLEPERTDAGPRMGDDTSRTSLRTPSRTYSADAGEVIVLQLWSPVSLERTGDLPQSAEARFYQAEGAAPDSLHLATLHLATPARLQDETYVVSLSTARLVPGTYWIELIDASGTRIAGYSLTWE